MAATALTATATKTARETSIRRGSQPFSTLKKEEHPMTSKRHATPADQTEQQPAEQPATKTVAEIQAELKATQEQLAAARATAKQARLAARAAREETRAPRDTRTPLEKVIARQAAQPGEWLGYLSNRVRDRVRAGQPLDEAIDAVFAHLRPYLVQKAEAAQAAQTEDEQVASSSTDSE